MLYSHASNLRILTSKQDQPQIGFKVNWVNQESFRVLFYPKYEF